VQCTWGTDGHAADQLAEFGGYGAYTFVISSYYTMTDNQTKLKKADMKSLLEYLGQKVAYSTWRHMKCYSNSLALISELLSKTCTKSLYRGILSFSFRSSTVTNPLAYRLLALDFEIWSKTRKEIQISHLEQFTTLLSTSRYKRFNLRQHLLKFGLVRKLLWILQTSMYGHDVIPNIVAALKTVLDHSFRTEDVKPVVAYLAVNLHECMYIYLLFCLV
jgi:hypothetical protein